jgi:HemK-like putative methylase
MKLQHKIAELRQRFASETIHSLLMTILGVNLTQLYNITDLTLPQLTDIDLAIDAYSKSIPMSRVLRRKFFWKSMFQVSPFTLDPRPETELLVEHAVKLRPKSVLDVGTGTGCILLSIMQELPNIIGVGSDISKHALSTARLNAQSLGLAAQFVCSNFYESIDQQFDLIVSNPPYIKTSCAYEAMFDPPIALWDTFSYLNLISRQCLTATGQILLEIPYYSLQAVQQHSIKSQLQCAIVDCINEIYICCLSPS